MIALLINVILLIFAYTYLRDLQSCACVQPLYVSRLQNIEILYIVFGLFGVLAVFLPTFNAFKFITSKLSRSLLITLSSVLGIASTALYIYFSYNTYQFVQSTPANCACAQKWPRFFIYLQSLMPFILILVTILLSIIASFFEIPYLSAAIKALKNRKNSINEPGTVSLPGFERTPTVTQGRTDSSRRTGTGTGTGSSRRTGTSRRTGSSRRTATGSSRRTGTGTGKRTVT